MRLLSRITTGAAAALTASWSCTSSVKRKSINVEGIGSHLVLNAGFQCRMYASSPPLSGGAHHSLDTNAQASQQSPQATIQTLLESRDLAGAVRVYETSFNPSAQTLVEFCGGNVGEVRDLVMMLMRAYTALGRMQEVRKVFVVALRDMAAQRINHSPADYRGMKFVCAPSAASSAALATPSPLMLDNQLLSTVAPLARSSNVDTRVSVDQSPITWERPSTLTAAVFNTYLEALTRRKNFDKEEVIFVINEMASRGVPADALTYHLLMEVHIRAGKDPQPLWNEMIREKGLRPLPVTVQTLLLRVVLSSKDCVFVVDVTREALLCGSTVLDKRTIAELIERWLGDGSTSAGSTQSRGNSSSPSVSSSDGGGAIGYNSSTSHYPPEYVLWLMLELEVRCVLDKSSFTHYMQPKHMSQLLLRCAKCADARTAEKALALMERHMLAKTADVLALVVWCQAQALEIEKALDLVEHMAHRGMLELTDPFRKFTIESLRYVMDRHFLVALADALSSVNLIERALAHLADRKRRSHTVTVHTLDLVVLAAGKVGEERRALRLVSSYESVWGVRPATNTLNCLLAGSSVLRGTALHRTIYDTMTRGGVEPNSLTFRTLIRQAVLSDNVDEAVFYLKEVSKYPGLRIEVEMVLPIVERAALAGDADTVNRISQFSLDCDVGIDKAVMHAAMKRLAEAGQNVDVLKGHLPLHEALRSRSKVGRQRPRSEVSL